MFDEDTAVYLIDAPSKLDAPVYAAVRVEADGFSINGPFGHGVRFQTSKPPSEEGSWIVAETQFGTVRLRKLRSQDDEVAQLGLTLAEMREQCSYPRGG